MVHRHLPSPDFHRLDFGVQVQRADYLIHGGGGFTNLAEHILSTPPQNVFLDTSATNASQFYYRIKVE